MTVAIPTGPIGHMLKAMISLERLKATSESSFQTLTGREKQVLTLVAEGVANPAIAEQLKISRVTVQNHRASIRQKLQITTEADYIKYAIAYDLIQL